MTDKKPEIGSPEHLEQVSQRAAERAKKMFKPDSRPEFDEIGVLSGSADLLEKTDAELFPDELEEYTPEERRKLFKLHKQGDKKNDDE